MQNGGRSLFTIYTVCACGLHCKKSNDILAGAWNPTQELTTCLRLDRISDNGDYDMSTAQPKKSDPKATSISRQDMRQKSLWPVNGQARIPDSRVYGMVTEGQFQFCRLPCRFRQRYLPRYTRASSASWKAFRRRRQGPAYKYNFSIDFFLLFLSISFFFTAISDYLASFIQCPVWSSSIPTTYNSVLIKTKGHSLEHISECIMLFFW